MKQSGPQRGIRQLLVYYKHFYRGYRKNMVMFPEIRLCGKWLKDIGFTHGQAITITTERNKIIITNEYTGKDSTAKQLVFPELPDVPKIGTEYN
jgi:toxic protein SymE